MKNSDGSGFYICTQCPLADCDEASLWCAYRWLTSPNQSQRQALESQTRGNVISRMAAIAKADRKDRRRKYLANYYQDNRERKLAMANERHRQNRQKRFERERQAAGSDTSAAE